jgi:hypothetical protein
MAPSYHVGPATWSLAGSRPRPPAARWLRNRRWAYSPSPRARRASATRGWRFADDLYLGYNGRMGAPPPQAAPPSALEYQLGTRWGLKAEYGDAQKGGADIIWRKR